jgi:hypothetical protein
MRRRSLISLDRCHPSRQTLTLVRDVTVGTVPSVGGLVPRNQISSYAPVCGRLLVQFVPRAILCTGRMAAYYLFTDLAVESVG